MDNNTAEVPKEKVAGCESSGGGCNRMNTFDWLSHREIDDDAFNMVEISFKNGARKDFFINPQLGEYVTGDRVVVSTGSGKNVGQISLSGELVRIQMRKKKVKESDVENKIIRRATEKDLSQMMEVRDSEIGILIKARVIVKTLDLDMKIGDIEVQTDKRKTTFYYTAEGRIDFRELIRHYAKEFKTKVEMRQIGIRQEAARIGGIGSCGRELCCSSWMNNFKVVTTTAVRYQNLAINQSKLSGQCGRLKCCLNFELDSYLDALKDFPKHANTLKTKAGSAKLMKTDIFKGVMYYFTTTEMGKRLVHPLTTTKVKEILAMNKKGEFPESLRDLVIVAEPTAEEEFDFDTVNDVIDLPPEERKKRKNRKNRRKKKPAGNTNPNQNNNNPNAKKDVADASVKPKPKPRPKRKPKPKTNPNPEAKPIVNKTKGNQAKTEGQPKKENPNANQPNTDNKENPNAKKNRNKNRNKRRNNRKKPNPNNPNANKETPNKPTVKKENPTAKKENPNKGNDDAKKD